MCKRSWKIDLRRSVRWVGLSAGVLMLLIAVATARWEVAWTSTTLRTVSVTNGAVMVFDVPPGLFPDGGYSPGWMSRPYGGHLRWTPTWEPGAGGRVTMPLWMPALLVMMSAFVQTPRIRGGTGKHSPGEGSAMQPGVA